MDRLATRFALLLGFAWTVGCVSSSSNVCDDGSTCPGGFVCDVDHDRCLLPEQIAACEGIADDQSCSLPSEPGAAAACRSGACIAYFCGDGYVTAGEDCEPGQTGEELTADCKDFGAYDSDGLACSSACTFDAGNKEARTGCYAHDFCGDLVVNGPELCDGAEVRTCVSIGFDAGTAACTLDCGFTLTDCSRFGWNPESLSDVVALAVSGSAVGDQWAFGMNGRAMHFEGAFWNSVPTDVANDLVAGWSIAPNDAWAVGSSTNTAPSVVIHWDGAVWKTVAGVPAGEYVDVWAASASEVYIATTSSVLKLSGTTWTTLPSFTGTPKQLRGSSGSDLWMTTVEGTLQHFDGASWSGARTPPNTTLQFLDVNSADDAWAIGYGANQGLGLIGHWTSADGWQLWSQNEYYNAIASSAPNDTWVAGVDGIMRHWDGIAWSRSANIGASPTGLTALSGLISLGADVVVGVSTLNLAYRYRGQAFGVFPPLGSNPFDTPDNTAMWGTSGNDQFVANVAGEIWHFDGDDWTLSYALDPAAPIKDLAGTTSTDLWAVANDGIAYHYDGVSWTPSMVTAGTALLRVWADPSGDVWVFAAGGGFHKTGPTWTWVPFGSGTPMSVSGSAPDNVYVVQTSPDALWHWDGVGWSEVETGATFPVRAVAALAPDDVHVAAGDGRFEHWDGTAWTETVLPVLDDITLLAYTAPDDVVGASERDLVHYDGRSWSTIRPPVDFTPNTADYLPIEDLQVSPGRIDMMLRRFRVRTLLRTRPLVCREHEVCGDAVDNDCNHALDSADSECP